MIRDWLLQNARPLDFAIMAMLAFNSWKIRFIVKWINGGCKNGKKKKTGK